MLIICFAKCTFYEKIKTKKVNKGLTNCFCFFLGYFLHLFIFRNKSIFVVGFQCKTQCNMNYAIKL